MLFVEMKNVIFQSLFSLCQLNFDGNRREIGRVRNAFVLILTSDEHDAYGEYFLGIGVRCNVAKADRRQ